MALMRRPFHSPIALELEEFLVWKRALGRRYQTQEQHLRSFDRLAAQDAAEHGEISLERAVVRWLRRAVRKPGTNHVMLSVVRQFCLFRRRRGIEGFVPGDDIVVTGRSHFRPYPLSVQDIRRLGRETRTLPGPNAPLRRATFRTLLLVLFCTGLRPGEAIRLTLREVDVRGRTFFISESKGKSRWVPFRDGLARQIKSYLRVRLAFGSSSTTSPLFVRPDGRGYTRRGVGEVFRRLWQRLGLKPTAGPGGPRVMDLRHAFASHRLARWYREGVDLHARLPWLSAYMGHEDLLGTETYLTASPDLLRVASSRFAARFRRRERP